MERNPKSVNELFRRIIAHEKAGLTLDPMEDARIFLDLEHVNVVQSVYIDRPDPDKPL